MWRVGSGTWMNCYWRWMVNSSLVRISQLPPRIRRLTCLPSSFLLLLEKFIQNTCNLIRIQIDCKYWLEGEVRIQTHSVIGEIQKKSCVMWWKTEKRRVHSPRKFWSISTRRRNRESVSMSISWIAWKKNMRKWEMRPKRRKCQMLPGNVKCRRNVGD